MKRKIGDKVKIRTDLVTGKLYDNTTLYPEMGAHLGHEDEVVFIENNHCRLKDIDFWWSNEMLEDIPDMKMNEYQEKAMQTCMESSNNLTYAIYGMLGEMGELLEKVVGLPEPELVETLLKCGTFAKHVRKGIEPELDLSIEDKKGFSLELGDQQWFTALSARLCGTDLSTIGEMNLDKLGSRKERGKIEGDGDYR